MRNAQSWSSLAVNQFITEKSRNKVVANKSWFTVNDGPTLHPYSQICEKSSQVLLTYLLMPTTPSGA
jgi:hypothetical protein